MKKTFFCALLLSGAFICFGQTNCNIKKAYAYYSVSLPGAQMADENGNPIPPKPIINRVIYIESIGTTKPDIKTVLYNNTALVFTIEKVKEKTVSVGDKTETNSIITITAKKGNTFWKLDLQPMGDKQMPETNCRNIIIKSRVTNKICRFYVYKETQFATFPRY